jgi:hypothetical protein
MTALLRGIVMPASLEASMEVRACTNVVMDSVSVTHLQKIKPWRMLQARVGHPKPICSRALFAVPNHRARVKLSRAGKASPAHERNTRAMGGGAMGTS